MIKSLYLILFLLFVNLPCQAQEILGSWVGAAELSYPKGNRPGTCPNLKIILEKNEKNELNLIVNPDCVWASDWHFSHNLVFALDKDGNLLGEDGYINSREFFWNSLIAWGNAGSKISLKLDDQNQLIVDIEETEEYESYNHPHFKGVLKPNPEPLRPSLIPLSNQLHGLWKGQVQFFNISDDGSRSLSLTCDLPEADLRYENGVFWQNHFYSEKCHYVPSRDSFNEYFGPYYFEYGQIFNYQNDTRQMTSRGTFDGHKLDFIDQEKNLTVRVKFDMIDEKHLNISKELKYHDMKSIPFEDRHYEIFIQLERK